MHEQAGVVAWRVSMGRVEVLLVTSRSSGRWIVPKGEIEAPLGRLGSAIEEAWEEGGVRGEGDPRALGSYTYTKWDRETRVALYALRVTSVQRSWPEAAERSRAWVPLRDAAGRIEEPSLAEFFDELDPKVLTRRPPLGVSWLPDALGHGRVGICSLPGERVQSLEEDLETLRSFGVTHLLCLVEDAELAFLDPVETTESRARSVEQAGMAYLHLPVEDFTAPTPLQIDRALAFADAAVRNGGAVVFHCWAGLGRAGTVLACWLVGRGHTAADAIVTTRWVRPGAIQSAAQEACIQRAATRLRGRTDGG
ncbi:MAG: dual specificity protein phosphatase family protein [Myxococcota bacterium]